MGLLNSTLLFWYLRKISNVFRGGWITCTKQYFGKLPIIFPESMDSGDASLRDTIADSVERVSQAHNKLRHSQTPQQRDILEREITGLERNIDRCVYDLYRLTENEIRVIEEASIA